MYKFYLKIGKINEKANTICISPETLTSCFGVALGRSGGAMELGKLLVPGVPLIWIKVGQGLTALAVGAGRVLFGLCSLVYYFSFLSPSLWDTARYRLKYWFKGSLSPKQSTNQLT